MIERVMKVLEFNKIKDGLLHHAASQLGKEKIEGLHPSFSFEVVQKSQQATYEGITVLRLKGDFTLGGIRDIRAALKRVAIGGVLSTHELLDIANTLNSGRKVKRDLEEVSEEQGLAIIQGWLQQMTALRELEQSIYGCIDQHAEVLDAASPALRTIRQQIRSFESRVKEKMEQMLRSSSVQKMLQDAIITVRNGRYCLPVKAEHRAHFGGMIHDQSASGATLFIEPGAVVNINNQLREAKLKEEKEIEKILRELSDKVREYVDVISLNVEALAELDFLFAKASYAQAMKAIQPKLNHEGYFKLIKARHPLISVNEVVPSSFELGQDFQAMVITGPNTGGKTVTLKTLGLCTLMACAGLAVPAEEGTEIAVVSSIYADIGDEQSIEQSLSTFSSHMTNIVQIIREMDHNSLVLFDELGAGTDPTEGAALAMSILDHVIQIGARVVATTHYSELKAYAYSTPQVMNASVEFDVETLRPTYRLLVGVPGRSNAFAIAQRLGLSQNIIEQAKTQIGEDDSRIEQMIASLEQNRKLAEKDREEAKRYKEELEHLKQELQRKEEQFEREKAKRVADATEQAESTMQKMVDEAEQIISRLRELAQQQTPIKEHELIEAKKRLSTMLEEGQSISKANTAQQKAVRKTKQSFRPGDLVFVHTFGQKGQILEKSGNTEYQVQIGIMKMKVAAEQMELVKEEKQKLQAQRASVKQSTDAVRLELDVRGQTIDEATLAVDKYLDQAVMSNYHQVSIIHGKGTGQLRKGLQDFLKKHRYVKQLRLGEAGEGGSGVTVVELK